MNDNLRECMGTRFVFSEATKLGLKRPYFARQTRKQEEITKLKGI